MVLLAQISYLVDLPPQRRRTKEDTWGEEDLARYIPRDGARTKAAASDSHGCVM